MKLLATAILFVVLFWQSAIQLSMVTWFWANSEYVQTELCEQREVEDNCCKGKCYLTKEVKKVEEPTTAETTTIRFSEIVYILPLAAYTPDVEGVTSFLGVYIEPKTSAYLSTIFHPPAVIFA
ncbi:MAG: hypothetical protein GC193_04570 [Cryomorphaceae bacterium]|nr:hypothetical protein [Cryomorphaceae bacterium]